MAMQITTDSAPCAVCHYPIQAPTHVGQQMKCLYCGSINEAISQGLSIPTPVVTGFLGLALGVILGPAILASTKSGSEWLAKQARERIK